MQQQRWSQLVAWYLAQKRDLPWRKRPTPYRVWVSEIMLQQTQVAVVIPYFERWMRRFPSVKSLAAAEVSQVLEMWAGLGYYRRARALYDGARLIVDQGFPKNHAGWLEVPGVGPYTAGAVCSIALGQVEPIVDGNVERVLARIYCAERDLKRIWKLSRDALKHAVNAGASPGDFNQALMELGATVCTKAAPVCGVCPMALYCKARRLDQVSEYPRPKPSVDWLDINEEVAVLVSQGKVLLAKNTEGWRKGLWDFPSAFGGWVKDRDVNQLRRLSSFSFKYVVTRHRVTRVHKVYRVAERSFRLGDGEARWVPLHRPGLAVGAPTMRALREIRESDVSLL